MDPNAALTEIRSLLAAGQLSPLELEDTERLIDLLVGLDGWLSKGGLLPEAWALAAAKPKGTPAGPARATKKRAGPLLPKVTSLVDLLTRARADKRYEKLLLIAAENLGGSPTTSIDAAYRWLTMNASETDEAGVVKEVNFCRDLVDSARSVVEFDVTDYKFNHGAEPRGMGRWAFSFGERRYETDQVWWTPREMLLVEAKKVARAEAIRRGFSGTIYVCT